MNQSAADPLPSLCVVIPMFNEAGGAERCVRAVCGALAALPCRARLLVVNDGSTDGTGTTLERLASEHANLEVLAHPRNLGYGRARRSGMHRAAEAGFSYALFMDSDLTDDPRDIPRFFEEMRRGVDVINASRFRPGGGFREVPLRRALVSRLGNRVARMLFGLPLTDYTNGFRALRLPLLERLDLQEESFPVLMEEMRGVKALARSYSEFPTVLANRSADQRPSSFRYTPRIFFGYLKHAFLSRLQGGVCRGCDAPASVSLEGRN